MHGRGVYLFLLGCYTVNESQKPYRSHTSTTKLGNLQLLPIQKNIHKRQMKIKNVATIDDTKSESKNEESKKH